MKKSAHFDIAKSVLALFIVLIGFGVFMLFYTNSETILQESFYQFIILTTIVFSLLIGLLYLVNNSKQPRVAVHKSSVKKHKKVRSRRR